MQYVDNLDQTGLISDTDFVLGHSGGPSPLLG
jgi:hypothetical protein